MTDKPAPVLTEENLKDLDRAFKQIPYVGYSLVKVQSFDDVLINLQTMAEVLKAHAETDRRRDSEAERLRTLIDGGRDLLRALTAEEF